MIAPWLIYVGTPVYNRLFLDDDTNLKRKAELAFSKSNLFLIPLYAMVLMQSIAWIYGMALYSEVKYDFKDQIPLFINKPTSIWEHFVFFAGLSFFTGLVSTAGHELVHKRETIHKIVGTIPYT